MVVMRIYGIKQMLMFGTLITSVLAIKSKVYAGVLDVEASIYVPAITEEAEAPSEEEILLKVKEMQSTIADVESFNKFNIQSCGLHIENKDGNDILVDPNGKSRFGYGYNVNGDLCLADEQGILRKDCIYDGMKLDENGLWVNPGMENAEQNKVWSEALERGEILRIHGRDALESFINYYMAQYRLQENCITLKATKSSELSENFSLCLPYELKYNRDGLVDSIVDNIGMPIGNTTKELTLSAVNNVCDYFEYDLAYIKRTMGDCLRDRKGVCWVYAKTVKALLDRCGVQSEIMTGLTYGENHMWLRVRDGEKWIYCDPTEVDSCESPNYFNISYFAFVMGWYPQPIACFENF